MSETIFPTSGHRKFVSTTTIGGLFTRLVDVVRLNTFSNANKSYACGLEFNYEQGVKFLLTIWSCLGAGFTFIYVNLSFIIRPSEKSLLPSISKNSANVSLFYERDDINVRRATTMYRLTWGQSVAAKTPTCTTTAASQ